MCHNRHPLTRDVSDWAPPGGILESRLLCASSRHSNIKIIRVHTSTAAHPQLMFFYTRVSCFHVCGCTNWDTCAVSAAFAAWCDGVGLMMSAVVLLLYLFDEAVEFIIIMIIIVNTAPRNQKHVQMHWSSHLRQQNTYIHTCTRVLLFFHFDIFCSFFRPYKGFCRKLERHSTSSHLLTEMHMVHSRFFKRSTRLPIHVFFVSLYHFKNEWKPSWGLGNKTE